MQLQQLIDKFLNKGEQNNSASGDALYIKIIQNNRAWILSEKIKKELNNKLYENSTRIIRH